MASPNPGSPPPSLEELSFRYLRQVTSVTPPREVAVLVHPASGSVTLVEGAVDIEALLRELPVKPIPSPATRASIDALPVVSAPEPGLECPICLVEYEVNAAVKEMPCGHRFHSGCVDRWLGIRGSCPMCRFSLPLEDLPLDEGVYESGGVRVTVIVFQGPDEAGLEWDEADTGTGLGTVLDGVLAGMDVESDGDGDVATENDEVAVEDMELDYID
ncbi:RING/U-box superfamily protein [Striga asiatica]|uniref:RING/U-box superfamily protein n=1 Tax=Striga asiatica TaxID=4170 RepID=A0A5A7QKI0_STRAF|nr:RING/U-box superfamily protein [Striga asiatica]